MSFLKNKDVGEKKNLKRNKKAAWIHICSFLSVIPLFIILSLTENGTIESNIPFIISMFITLTFVFFLNWFWFDSMDEFEKITMGNASFWGLSATTIVVPWEILSQLNIVSKPDAIYIVLFGLTITLLYYYTSKFRA